jgi:subtilisin family serine protease
MHARFRFGWGTSIALSILSLFLVSFAPAGLGPTRQGQPGFVPGQIIVGLRSGTSINTVAGELGASDVAALGGGNAFLLDLSGDPSSRAAEARTLAGVSYAEPNWLRQLHVDPNDPDFPVKWDLNNDGDVSLCDGSDCPSVDADMDWLEAFELLGSSFSGMAVVAVIDTGIDPNHPDLNDKIVPGYDFLDGDTDPTDTYGHGTHVAGTVAPETNNSLGTAGVGFGPNIKIMPLRVCSTSGCPTSAIVNAIYYAASKGANVINLSLGGPIGSNSEEQAINYAWSNGLVIVASSGNDSSGRVSYPAAFVNSIAVGSTNWNDQLAPYSNKGRDLDVVAPGGDMSRYHDEGGIYSTMPIYDVYLTTNYSYSKNYDQLQGTSMAAPQVSGLAALLFAMGGVSNTEVRNIIESTADDLGKNGWDRTYGWGRVNVYAAVLAAQGANADPTPSPTPDPTPDPTPTPTPPPGGGNSMYVWTVDFTRKAYGRGGTFRDLITTVTIQSDSDGDGFATSSDTPVADASVLMTLAFETDGGGIFECNAGDSCWNFVGTTGSNGEVTFTLKRAPLGDYQAFVTNVSHSTFKYDSGLDADNPDSFTLE